MLFLLLTWLALAIPTVSAQQPGTFVKVGNTLVSAMMLFVGGPNKVYIIDKVEGNAAQIGGHPVWASVWDINARTAIAIDAQTNPFCAAGMHLPNGSFAVFGGNSAIGPGGFNNDPGSTPQHDPVYGDYFGTNDIRMITSCPGDPTQPPCVWYDTPNTLQMLKNRWYPAAESLPTGAVVLIGGFSSGGYINRDFPNLDPTFESGQAEPTYEFFPPTGQIPQIMPFMPMTSGLNAFALTYLMPSGRMFVQANFSTTLWDYNANTLHPLPDMPGQVIRVYPASGANAMLPLTPYNAYTPTIIFCGGQVIDEAVWGNYQIPHVDTWTIAASPDCHRITPEPVDGSAPTYIQDDNLPVGRTMGQFIALPDGTFLLLNGAQYGTAGYAVNTLNTPQAQMPYGMSLATSPILQPLIYNPNAPLGSRWSTAGLSPSTVPRLYHSTATLLPDGSVMVAGSNPSADVNLAAIYPTTYTAEYFYPPYFSAPTRPVPQNVPTTLSYGGTAFDITVPSTSYTGDANAAAANTTVWLIRPGFSTHGMNLGQRSMQLNNTYTVHGDGTILVHTAQLPPYPNLFQPGPAFLFVTISGIPSNGTYVIVGNGQVGPQPTAPASVLPASQRYVVQPSPNATAPTTNTPTNGKKNGASPPPFCAGAGYRLVPFLIALAVTLALS